MSDDRHVWVIGDPEEGAHASTHRYHLSQCYVLDQVGNRGRTRKVRLADLPEGYASCQICAPGTRAPRGGAASGKPSASKGEKSTGVQPGHVVEAEDVETGLVVTYRIASLGRRLGPGEVSARSPVGAALIGQPEGAVVKFAPPKGGLRKLRILRFEQITVGR